MIKYKTAIHCAVCDAVVDEIIHPDPEPDGVMMAMMQDGIRNHLYTNPQCMEHPRGGMDVHKFMGQVEVPDEAPGPDGVGAWTPPAPDPDLN